MDTENISDRLDRICVRLDQIQNQHVDVLEMKAQIKEIMAAQRKATLNFDQANDMLACQSEKQTAIENIAPQIISNLQQEKTFMRDQLSQAQQEILGRLTEIQSNLADGDNSSVTSQTNKMFTQITESMTFFSDVVMHIKAKILEQDDKLTQLSKSVSLYSDVVMDIGANISQQDDKLNQLKADISNIKQSSYIEERTRDCTEQVDKTKLADYMKTIALMNDKLLSEVRDAHAQFKGMTKAEFVLLENMVDNKLADIMSRTGTNLQATEKIDEKVEHMLANLNSINDDVTSLNKSFICEFEQIKADMNEHNQKCEESSSSLTKNHQSASDKLRDSVVKTLENFEERANKQLSELTSQNDSINNLKKQMEDLRQQNLDFKKVIELETKKTGEIMSKNLKELTENIHGVILGMNTYFIETLPKECKDVSDRIYTIITDETQKLSNCIVLAQTEILKQTVENAKLIIQNMCDVKEKCSQTVSNTSKIQENLDAIRNQVKNVENMVNTIDENLETVAIKSDKHVETVLNNVEKYVKNIVNSVEKTAENSVGNLEIILKENLTLLTNKQSEVQKQQEKSSDDVKDLIVRTKHEIWAMTEKEAQLVRDRIEGPLPSRGKYTFYFHVLNFQSEIRSGKDIDGLPWYINEIKSCVRGSVTLTTDGQLQVWLLRGRHPLCVGLQPVTGLKSLKVKATICDIDNKTLPDLELGEETLPTDERGIGGHIHQGWGRWFGSTSCDDLVQKGYGGKEGYTLGAVLIRYDVTVV